MERCRFVFKFSTDEINNSDNTTVVRFIETFHVTFFSTFWKWWEVHSGLFVLDFNLLVRWMVWLICLSNSLWLSKVTLSLLLGHTCSTSHISYKYKVHESVQQAAWKVVTLGVSVPSSSRIWIGPCVLHTANKVSPSPPQPLFISVLVLISVSMSTHSRGFTPKNVISEIRQLLLFCLRWSVDVKNQMSRNRWWFCVNFV